MPNSTNSYLLGVKTDVLVRSLYRASNAAQVLRAFVFYSEAKELKPWIVLRPLSLGSQMLLVEDKAIRLSGPQSERLAKVRYPDFTFAAGHKASWVQEVEAVMDAFGLPFPVEISTVWQKGNLIAITGISDTTGLMNRQMDMRGLVFDLAQAILRLHELEVVQSELDGTRIVLDGADKALILVTQDGVILAHTARGRDLLLNLIHGTRRPNGSGTMPTLPPKIVSILLTVKDREQVVLSETASAVITVIQRPLISTTPPLRLIELLIESHTQNLLIPENLNRLSPRELEILRFLIQGRRDKEIALLGCISLGTVRNHVSRIYQKLGCTGRPELLSMAARLFSPYEVPALGTVEGLKLSTPTFTNKMFRL